MPVNEYITRILVAPAGIVTKSALSSEKYTSEIYIILSLELTVFQLACVFAAVR